MLSRCVILISYVGLSLSTVSFEFSPESSATGGARLWSLLSQAKEKSLKSVVVSPSDCRADVSGFAV